MDINSIDMETRFEILSGVFQFSRDGKCIFVDTFYHVHNNATIETINNLDNIVNEGIYNLDSYIYNKVGAGKTKVYSDDSSILSCLSEFKTFEPILLDSNVVDSFLETF